MTLDQLDTERDGQIHPCNGYILVAKHEARVDDLVVIEFNENYRCAVVIEMSDDDTDGMLEVKTDWFGWRKGDLIYFKESIEVDGSMFVHWTDVVAYKRFV